MGITVNTSTQQITANVGETKIDVSVGGGVGPTGSQGSSGTVSVSAPITNAGTSTAAVIGLSVGDGLTVSGGSIVLPIATANDRGGVRIGSGVSIDVNGVISVSTNYAAASHSHAISDVTGLQAALDGKAASSHTHGNITSDGKIGTASGRIVVTTSGGSLAAATTIGAGSVVTESGTLLSAINQLVADVAAYGLPYIIDVNGVMRPLTHAHAPADVTFASTDRLIGRSSAGAGAGQEIVCTAAGRSILALSLGTAGQVLKVNAGATGVEWGLADSDVRSDTVSSTTYTGRAAPGSATSATVWKIRRTIYTSAGAVSSTATATNVRWNDRLTASYS